MCFTLKVLTGCGASSCRQFGRLRLRSEKQHRTVWWRTDSYLYLFLGTGCMIKLQSSMSKHIPVSDILLLMSSAAILCLFLVVSSSFFSLCVVVLNRYQLAFFLLLWKSRPALHKPGFISPWLFLFNMSFNALTTKLADFRCISPLFSCIWSVLLGLCEALVTVRKLWLTAAQLGNFLSD